MVCERHDEIKDCIDDLKKRVRILENNEGKLATKLDNLTDKFAELARALDKFSDTMIKIVLGISGTSIAILSAFFIWYVQNIG